MPMDHTTIIEINMSDICSDNIVALEQSFKDIKITRFRLLKELGINIEKSTDRQQNLDKKSLYYPGCGIAYNRYKCNTAYSTSDDQAEFVPSIDYADVEYRLLSKKWELVQSVADRILKIRRITLDNITKHAVEFNSYLKLANKIEVNITCDEAIDENNAKYFSIFQDARIITFHFDNNAPINDLAIPYLVDNFNNARKLDLSFQHHSPGYAEKIGQIIKDTAVQSINFKDNNFGNSGAKILIQYFKDTSTLKSLDLTKNNITDITGIIGALEGTPIRSLNLSHNKLISIDNIGNKRLYAGRNILLVKADLNFSCISPSIAGDIGNVLKSCPFLKTLVLTGNPIKDAGAKDIIEAFRGTSSLKNLNLCSTGITNNGIKEILNTINDTPIEHLGLSNNSHVSLSDNSIDDCGAQYLSDALKSLHHLRGIYLSYNQITEIGANYLLEALPGTSITHLSIKPHFVNHFTDVLEVNRAIALIENSLGNLESLAAPSTHHNISDEQQLIGSHSDAVGDSTY